MKNTLFLLSLFFSSLLATDESPLQAEKETMLHEKPSQVPEKIVAKPETPDEEITQRLEEILKTTGWFIEPQVIVKKGVVFLSGETKNHQFKDWAGDLAHHTEDVAAIVNKIVVREPSVWDLHMILSELLTEGRKLIRAIPAIVFATLILFLSWLLARLVYKVIPFVFRDKMNASLLHEVFARAVSILVFILGVYFIFEMADLTTLALTILSGTGLIGIIVGIAFRDITENFLASVLLSLQNPFHVGDLIDVVNPVTGYAVTGYVERLTLRVTILVLLDGNHLQIPNATVYKSHIRNHTSNPLTREDFIVPVPLCYSLAQSIEAALKILTENEAILKEPEPLVLVDHLGKESVDLHIYYWTDSRQGNCLKIRSSVIRLIKQAFEPEKERKEEEIQQTSSETQSDSDDPTRKMGTISPDARTPEGGKNLLNPKR